MYIKELKELDDVGCLTINQKVIDKIYIYYQRLRNTVRTVYMKKNSGDLSLDRHKVGSCIMYGILCSKIIHVNKKLIGNLLQICNSRKYFAIFKKLFLKQGRLAFMDDIEAWQLNLQTKN